MTNTSRAMSLSRRNLLTIAGVGAGISLLVAMLALGQSGLLARLDHQLLDGYLRAFASGETSRDTVVIDIDDVSLSAVGQWPWPRYRLAALLEQVAAAKPAAIALDVMLPEPDRVSLSSIQQSFKRDFGIDVSFGGVPAGLRDNDGYLGQVIAQAGVVGSRYFYFDHRNPPGAALEPGLRVTGRTDLLTLHDAAGVLSNVEAIASRTATSGFLNTRADSDGVQRRLPLLIRHEGLVHVHLSLAAVMKASGLREVAVVSRPGGAAIQLGRREIPIDAAGYATLRFEGGPRLYPALSAVDVLNGRVGEAALRGKIVFIGTSAVGLGDLHNTAFDPQFPGPKIHAVMAQNMLDGRHLATPVWAPWYAAAACLLAGALVSALFVFGNGMRWLVGGSATIAAAVVSLSTVLYLRAELFVSPAAPLVVVAALFATLCAVRFAIEKRRSRIWLEQLANARQVTIESMASVAETRDPETGAHIKRTQNYVRAIAEELKRSGHYTETLSSEFIELLFISAPLHDIGKVGVPDHILLKPGKLTPEEMEIMKRHAEFGSNIVLSTAQRIEGDNFLVIAGEIAATHHEKWDGTGYPRGLAGQAIPLAGRIMAVADIYDALISRRCYKEPFTHALATTLMRGMRGQNFDPVVLDAFFRIETDIVAIAARYQDEMTEAASTPETRPASSRTAPAAATEKA